MSSSSRERLKVDHFFLIWRRLCLSSAPKSSHPFEEGLTQTFLRVALLLTPNDHHNDLGVGGCASATSPALPTDLFFLSLRSARTHQPHQGSSLSKALKLTCASDPVQIIKTARNLSGLIQAQFNTFSVDNSGAVRGND